MTPKNRESGLIAVLFTLLLAVLAVSSWASFTTPVVARLELRMGSSSFYKSFPSYINKKVLLDYAKTISRFTSSSVFRRYGGAIPSFKSGFRFSSKS